VAAVTEGVTDVSSPVKNFPHVKFMLAAVATTTGVPYVSCSVQNSFRCEKLTPPAPGEIHACGRVLFVESILSLLILSKAGFLPRQVTAGKVLNVFACVCLFDMAWVDAFVAQQYFPGGSCELIFLHRMPMKRLCEGCCDLL